MAITSYVSKTGETLWKASACVRSEKNVSIRVQKAKFALKSEWEAKREETRLIRECEREASLRETQGSSWGALVDVWERHLLTEQAKPLAETTRSDYISALKKHTHLWWKRSAASITRADVLEVLNQLKAHSNSISYQNKMKVIINRIFVYGMDHRLIDSDRSPAYGINLGREEEKKPEILTLTEIRKLLFEARRINHPWFSIWSMALLTGMRSGELYALLWSDVDVENKVLSVNKSFNPRMKL
jgi:integrase